MQIHQAGKSSLSLYTVYKYESRANRLTNKMNSLINMLHIPLPILVMDLIGILFSIGVVFLGGIWCMYYTSHALMVKRKIKALKGYREHMERERYLNAVIEYRKSAFIVLISFSESLLGISYWGVISYRIFSNNSRNGTEHDFAFYIEKYPTYDILVSGFISLFILMSSLVCILTSYLTKAYGTNRKTKLKEKQLFIWMFLQLFIGWCLCLIPTIRTVGLPVYALYIFIGQIIVYVMLSRRLYSVLRRRREDAYFEDRELYGRMVRMCSNFRFGAVAYTTVLVFLLCELTAEIVKYLFVELMHNQFLREYMFSSGTIRVSTQNQIKLYLCYMCKVIAVLMLFFSFMVHLIVLVKAIVSSLKRRRYLRDQIRGVNNMMNAPLIG